jgi:GNAT superfamily N-acetyltransferase
MFRFETVTSRLDKPRRELLRSRLRQTNTESSAALRALRGTPHERDAPLQIWVFAADGRTGRAGPTGPSGADGTDGELVAGLDAHTWAWWLHVNLLWVDARHRGSGLGSRLLANAERIAREKRGCRHSRVWTWDFQAPEFYRKHGYDVVCTIPDYPPGVTEYTLTKRIG